MRRRFLLYLITGLLSFVFFSCSGGKGFTSTDPKDESGGGSSRGGGGEANTPPEISHACSGSINQNANYSCSFWVIDPDDGDTHSFSLASSNDCAWATIHPSSGAISGTPNDDQVGSCTLAFRANDQKSFSAVKSLTVNVRNIAPTLSITDTAMAKASALSIVRSDLSVQASEEGFGTYSLSEATAPKCSDNGSLSINVTTGAVSYDPVDSFEGLCNIRVSFNDGNPTDNTVSAEFAVNVTTVPTVSNVLATANGLYSAAQNLDFTLQYSTAVDVDTSIGTPSLAVDIGGQIVQANYVSGTGSTDLLFRHTLGTGFYDNDGVSLAASINTNGGTITDAVSGFDAQLSFSSPDLSGLLVDSDTPTITAAACPAGVIQGSAYSCTPSATDPDSETLIWSFAMGHDCSWATINPSTGVISGTPGNSDVGSCFLAIGVSDGTYSAPPVAQGVSISNLAPTLSISNATSILEDAASTLIRSDAQVQASDEGPGGSYSFDHATTTAPKCNDNSISLTINASTGAINYQPSANYNGTCNIKVRFDDGHATNNLVADEFSITVTPVNDIPSILQSCLLAANEDQAYSCAPSVTDVDNGDSHTWSFSGAHNCSWLNINSSTGAITGTPQGSDVGSCTLGFQVNDGTVNSAATNLTVTVTAAPGATFVITGVNGGTDAEKDEHLLSGSDPRINWEPTSAAVSYEVTVYEADGTTVACATQSTTNTSYAFTGCNLPADTKYIAEVVAKDARNESLPAQNNSFPFFTTNPTPASLCASGNGLAGRQTLTSASGRIVDSGGTAGNYSANENCFVEILPNGATSISISTTSFGSNDASDILEIHNANASLVGDPTSGTYRLGSYSNSVYGPNGIRAESGEMTVFWKSNASGQNTGYELTYKASFSPKKFKITGVTGGTDNNLDGFLGNGATPIINWEAATGATSYEVLIRDTDNETTKCNKVSTTNTYYDFSACSLTASQTYFVQIVAYSTDGFSTPASNNGFEFQVATPPAPGVAMQSYIKAADPGGYDNYAGFVALDKDTLVVSAKSEDSNQSTITNGSTASADNSVVNTGAAYVYFRNGTAWDQQAYLKVPNLDSQDAFSGGGVSISGDTLVVGAPEEDSSVQTIIHGGGTSTDNSATAAGAAYVFVRNGTNWSLQAYLKAPNAEAGDRFGHSVAIDGDTILVGAYGEDNTQSTITNGGSINEAGTGNNTGAVYAFTRVAQTWSLQSYLKSPNPGDIDNFGFRVALSGDTALVTAHVEDSNQTTITNGPSVTTNNSASDAGAAYIFNRTGSTWSHQAYIKAPNAKSGSQFGAAIAIDGDTAIVSSTLEGHNSTSIVHNSTLPPDNGGLVASGGVYVFVRNGSSWTHQAYIKAPNADTNDYFGSGVALSGDSLVVGAMFEASNQSTILNNGTASSDNSATSAGAAYLFKRTGSTWSFESYIKPPNMDAGDYFGTTVAIDGTTVAVGANYEKSAQNTISNDGTASTDNSLNGAGAAYVFTSH